MDRRTRDIYLHGNGGERSLKSSVLMEMRLAGCSAPRTTAVAPRLSGRAFVHPLRAGLRSNGSETKDSETKEQTSNQRDDHELRPNHVDASTAVEDGLRKGDEMS